MKRLTIAFMLILLVSSSSSVSQAQNYTNVTVPEAKSMIDSTPSLVVLDVRTQSEYDDDGHIRNAKLIPHTELSLRLDELNQTGEILVYCRSGSRSAIASQILVDAGFQYIYNMLGGILDWIAAEYPAYVKYSSIQEVINNANEGDTIFVGNGTYYENLIVNKTISLVGENCSTTIIDGNGTGHVIDIIRDNVNVTGFMVQGGQSGIRILNARFTEIYSNAIAHNYGGEWDAGIRLDSAGYSRIHSNLIVDNWRGILLYTTSPNVSLYCNNITENEFAIRVASGGSNYLIVSDNTVMNNRGYGIGLTGFGGVSNYATISGNHLVNNSDGLALGQSSNYNTILHNTVSQNGYGFYIESSTQNTIWGNNIVENTQQVYVSTGSVNNWDAGYPSGGNYWSNHQGTDGYSGPYQNETGSDGIGDSPYVVNGENQDNYPLMYPFGFFPWDVTGDGYIGIDDIVLVAEHFGQDPAHPDWNSKYDITGDSYVGMDDIVEVAGHFGEAI